MWRGPAKSTPVEVVEIHGILAVVEEEVSGSEIPHDSGKWGTCESVSSLVIFP